MQENQQKLRKVVSDVSSEMDKYYNNWDSTNMDAIEEVQQVECECCGLREDCTAAYISEIEERYCGKWVCGLCSEAVKERQRRAANVGMEEAQRSHKEFCDKYNFTTRLNPKLSLTLSMRDIAKRSLERRDFKGLNATKLGRSTSYP